MNGVTTQGENMADNGGMRQAFLAYKKYVADNGPDQHLPGLQQFSPEQLFFLGFATVGLKMQEWESNRIDGENWSVKGLLLVVCITLVPPKSGYLRTWLAPDRVYYSCMGRRVTCSKHLTQDFVK